MTDIGNFADGEPPVIDPYETLGLAKQATADQVKSAYRKAALRNHPDKVSDEQKEEAHAKFQEVAFAYAVLSDPVRRKRYDTTGSTSDSIVDADGFNWSDYYREQFKDSVSADAINKFAEKYKGSDEERADVLIAYEECEGDMDQLFERVMLSDIIEDDERFRKIIDEAIVSGDVPAFDSYKREPKRKRSARLKAAKAEAIEAEDYAKELGVHDRLFARKGKKSKGSSEDDLAALIQKRQQDRSASFLDHLADKYGANSTKGKGGKKRAVEEDEPSEDAFQAAAAKLKNSKSKRAKK
ncbi:hypothetical protein C2857_005902 [Epichloe festucae Fl1]|uniref:J domain-containing protein n=1 Tax=Epichloe festucae (strain Fl1) TaxID=877507 RepID=A0A7S9PSD4_EPIFF|nr:hypothetical protein C2857_005902 [Epichloe festucae Fl1]